MDDTLGLIKDLVARREVRVSKHGSEELAADSVTLEDVLQSASDAVLVEDYGSDWKGPSVLAMHCLRDDRPLHVVWALAKDTTTPAVLVTAYRPDPRRWSPDFMRRRT